MVYFREYQMQGIFSRGFSSCFKGFAVVGIKTPHPAGRGFLPERSQPAKYSCHGEPPPFRAGVRGAIKN